MKTTTIEKIRAYWISSLKESQKEHKKNITSIFERLIAFIDNVTIDPEKTLLYPTKSEQLLEYENLKQSRDLFLKILDKFVFSLDNINEDVKKIAESCEEYGLNDDDVEEVLNRDND